MYKPGSTYRVTKAVKVCCYDENECILPDMIELPTGTGLTYVGPDADHDTDNGEIFADAAGTKYCLHHDDLTSIQE